MNYCKDCKWFTDGHYSKTYISPTCTARGTDAAAYMREFVCGVENPTLFEPRAPKPEREGLCLKNNQTIQTEAESATGPVDRQEFQTN